MKILLVTQPMPAQAFIDAIRARAPELELIEYRSALRDAELADVDVVLGWQMPSGLPARTTARSAGSARSRPGSRSCSLPTSRRRFVVSRIVDREQAAGIAQFVVMMALRHARDLERYEAQQRQRDWSRQPVAMARHRVVVLGTGAMGGEIAAWLERCGLVVRGWNRRSPETFEAVLAASEIVVCALPLTAETEGILDARAFALMPKRRLRHQRRARRARRRARSDRGGALGPPRAALRSTCRGRNRCPATIRSGAFPGSRSRRTSRRSRRPETIADQFVASVRALSAARRCRTRSTGRRGY